MRLEFKPEDFAEILGPGQGGSRVDVWVKLDVITQKLISDHANARLKEEMERREAIEQKIYDDLYAVNRKLIAALEFYASESNWNPKGEFDDDGTIAWMKSAECVLDGGERARAALKISPGELPELA